MDAGRELDALVAEKVMGWKRQENTAWRTPHVYLYVDHNGHVRLPEEVPHYSTDIAAAWQVFEHFAETHKVLAHTQRMSLGWTFGQPLEWHCTIGVKNTAVADTAPLAICLAALRALGLG